MPEYHERFIDGLCEARWQPGARPEIHKGENKQSYRAEEQRSEADKLKQIKIELLNMPILALEMPGSKRAGNPDPVNSDTRGKLAKLCHFYNIEDALHRRCKTRYGWVASPSPFKVQKYNFEYQGLETSLDDLPHRQVWRTTGSDRRESGSYVESPSGHLKRAGG
jgi:hypothetical protein